MRRRVLELTDAMNDLGMLLPLLPISTLLHLHFLRKLHRGHPFFSNCVRCGIQATLGFDQDQSFEGNYGI
jgi:hypothetical protein